MILIMIQIDLDDSELAEAVRFHLPSIILSMTWSLVGETCRFEKVCRLCAVISPMFMNRSVWATLVT